MIAITMITTITAVGTALSLDLTGSCRPALLLYLTEKKTSAPIVMVPAAIANIQYRL